MEPSWSTSRSWTYSTGNLTLIFDISEAQAEAVVEPDGVTDDFRRKSVSAIAGRVAAHRRTLPPVAST